MMKNNCISLFFLITILASAILPKISAAKAPGDQLSVPLQVIHRSVASVSSFPVSGGIPFPEGMLFPDDISSLTVVDGQGRSVPARFDPFVLWWGKDRSVKWLRVDMMAHGRDVGTGEYVLTRGNPSAAGQHQIQVTESSREFTVDTGRLKAIVSKQRGTLLESVVVDGREVIRPNGVNGIHITSEEQQVVYGTTDEYNMWGSGSGRITDYEPKGILTEHTYLSGMGRPESVEVEADGPVRATIRIQGRHYPQKTGPGIRNDGFYYYTVRLHFFAGKSFIKIEHAIDNNRQEYPIHIYRIKDLRLHFTVDEPLADSPVRYLIGGETQDLEGTLNTGHISIFQDSANKDRWNLHSYLKGKTKEERKNTPGHFYHAEWKIGPARFRGYKIIDDRDFSPDAELLESGDHAPGWAALGNEKAVVSIHMHRFWEECPKAIVLGRSFIEPVLFPNFSPEVFQIHSGARKSHTFYLNFKGSETGFEAARQQADLFARPPLLKTEDNWYAKTLALPRAMGIHPGRKTGGPGRWYPHFRWDKGIITARWKTAGLSTGFNAGGMHANYWPIFTDYIQSGDVWSYENGMIHAKWASESIPWLIDRHSFGPDETEPQNRLIGWGEKALFTSQTSTQVEGWVHPYTRPVPGFSSPAKFHLDGEHLIHVWPYEWYYLTGTPLARDGLMAVGNQAKYSTHRNFFKSKPKYKGPLHSAPSLDHLFYFDDSRFPERVPWYFYTRIYTSHLLSTAMTYGATGDEDSLFYSQWLARRMLYLQKQHGGVLGEEKRWNNIPPWQESEAAIAAFELYKETGDMEMLDIMGSWLEWAWHEAYVAGKGMPHRFKRGTPKEQLKKMEHHWYPGVAAPLCYAALGDARALEMTKEWADSSLAYIKKGEFLDKPVGQSASYVLNYLEKNRQDKVPPDRITDLTAAFDSDVRGVRLSWSAPEDKGEGSSGAVHKYWIKIADRPIVDHPQFPEGLKTERGFYQADNIRQAWVPRAAGTQETVAFTSVAPHGAYGSDKEIKIDALGPGIYYLAIKSWDEAGNMSRLSNVAKVEIP